MFKTNMGINVLVVDHQPIVRLGIKQSLKGLNKISKCDEVSDGAMALDILSERNYKVIYLDIEIPGMKGGKTVKIIKEKYPETKVIIFTAIESKREIIETLELGVEGYILKDGNEISKAFEEVMKGNIYLSLRVHSVWSDYLINKKRNIFNDYGVYNLSKREEEVLLLFCLEKTTNEIAELLFISPKTVKNHFENLKRKLNVKTKMGILHEVIRSDFFQSPRF